MKQLLWKLVLPLTLISFIVITKWWQVAVVNGPDEILYGFPLPFICSGWHTSMSYQIFIFEFVFDFFIYFSFWFFTIYLMQRYIDKVNLHKAFTIVLPVIAIILFVFAIVLISSPDNIYPYQREFEMEVMKTGVSLF